MYAAVRDAASLILIRGDAADPQVLLGRRAASNRFMPGMYVFPGGVVQRDDFRAGGELDSATAALMGVRGDRDRAAAIANAALRETAEETGLMVGVGGVGGSGDGDGADGDGVGANGGDSGNGWRLFTAAGIRPDLTALTYLGRAVTPVGMPLRFNARFFAAAVSVHGAGAAAHGTLTDSDELAGLTWVSPRRPNEWRPLPMVDITVYILNHFTKILSRARRRHAFVFRHHRDRAHVRWHKISR